MQTQNNVMFGHGVLANLFERPVENQAIIDEEENGYGLQLTNQHLTAVNDKEVQRKIIDMSIIEIIS
ncbi:MAG: hypothetical protein ACK42D_01605 [Candidatus Paceibacteria bacterium]